MPGSNVSWPVPLQRLNPWYPGQFGVPGTDSETGLRLHSTGTVFYVDPNAPGVSDQRDGTDPTAPLQTVATALTKCQPYRGDVIAVMANNSWQYGDTTGYVTPIAEEVTITVPGVRLVGISPSGLGVYWYPASDGGTCITVHALDVTIEGFVFSEGPDYTGCTAISVEWDGATLYGDNATIRHCVFDDTVDTGIALEYAWYCDIHHNSFWQCDEYGIFSDVAGSGMAYNLIHNNQFHDCDVAMSLLGGADDNQIWANSIYNRNAEGAALATNEGINTTGGSRNQIFDNYFSCVLPAAANGDWDDLNTGAATDAWINNHCTDGMAVTTPT